MITIIIPTISAIANPAAVYCEELGYELSTKTDEEGNEYTVCVFPDGNYCEEWEFFRGECGQEYRKEIECKKAGEEITVGECCEGLKSISKSQPEDGICRTLLGAWNICSDCGNNVCESWENVCNCPEDCETITEPSPEPTNIIVSFLEWIKAFFSRIFG